MLWTWWIEECYTPDQSCRTHVPHRISKDLPTQNGFIKFVCFVFVVLSSWQCQNCQRTRETHQTRHGVTSFRHVHFRKKGFSCPASQYCRVRSMFSLLPVPSNLFSYAEFAHLLFLDWNPVMLFGVFLRSLASAVTRGISDFNPMFFWSMPPAVASVVAESKATVAYAGFAAQFTANWSCCVLAASGSTSFRFPYLAVARRPSQDRDS